MSRYRKSMAETMAEVEKIGQELPEVSPPGWKGSVKAMKKHKDIDNPWALAWHMKNKGDKPHYKDKEGEPEKKAKYNNEGVETKDIVLLNEKHDCAEVHPDISHEDWTDQKDEDMSLAPKGKGRKAAKALYKEDEVDESGDLHRTSSRRKWQRGFKGARRTGNPDDQTGTIKRLRKNPKTGKEWYGIKKEEVELAIMSLDHKKFHRKLKITQKGLDALRTARDKPKEKSTTLRLTKKGREAIKDEVEIDEKSSYNKMKRAEVTPRRSGGEYEVRQGKDMAHKLERGKKKVPGKKAERFPMRSSGPKTLEGPKGKLPEDVEMEEMQFKVKLKGLPSFYVPSKSAATVKAMLRKQMRRPDDIESIDRVTKSAKKRDFRLRVQGKQQDGE